MSNNETIEMFLHKKRGTAALNITEMMSQLEQAVPNIKRPYKENKSVQDVSAMEARICVATEEGIIVLMKKNKRWSPYDILLNNESSRLPHIYRSLSFFQVERIPYIAASFSGGIDIVSLDKSEIIKIRMKDSYQKTDLVEDIFFISSPDILSSKIISAHTRKGLVCVSVDELLHSSKFQSLYLPKNKTTSSDRGYIEKSEEIHTTVFNERIFCGQGDTVYEFDQGKKTFSSILCIPAQITSLGKDYSGKMYVGTDEGLLFSDDTVCVQFSPKRSIVKIVAGVYEGMQGVYVLQRKNGRYANLHFVTNNSTIDNSTIDNSTINKSVTKYSVSPISIVQESMHIRDFAISDKLCAAIDQNEGLFIKEEDSAFLPVALTQKKIRSVALLGGIYK